MNFHSAMTLGPSRFRSAQFQVKKPCKAVFTEPTGGGIGAVVRSLPSNPKVSGSIPGLVEG